MLLPTMGGTARYHPLVSVGVSLLYALQPDGGTPPVPYIYVGSPPTSLRKKLGLSEQWSGLTALMSINLPPPSPI